MFPPPSTPPGLLPTHITSHSCASLSPCLYPLPHPTNEKQTNKEKILPPKKATQSSCCVG